MRGAFDALTAPRLVEAIDGGLDAAKSAFIVDLSQLDFLASAGNTVLPRGHQAAAEATRFGIVADGPSTSRSMKLMALDQELRPYSTLHDAPTDAV